MAAGFDTTASTLNFCFYVLLTHPDELIKLQEEVDSLVFIIKIDPVLFYQF